MAINKKLITFASKSVFTGANGINGATTATNGYYGNIPAYSIVFIKDTGEIWHNGKYISGGIWGTKQDNYVPLKIAGTEYNLSLNGHKQSYTTLTGSTSTANQAIVSSGTKDGWTLKTLGSRAFDSTDYLPLSGGTISGNLTVNGVHRDTYYASNLCRHFYGGTPNQFVIKTKIKYVSSSHMPLIRIYGYAYGLNSPIELRVGFYIYGGQLGWSGVSCTGAWKPEVYLFKYTEDSTDYVAIGFKGACYFCGFQVDAQVGALGAFNQNFITTGWSTTHNGEDTSVSLIPAVGTDNCIQVSYKEMATDISGKATSADTWNNKPSWIGSSKPSYAASEISGLATVATSGKFADLLEKPTTLAGYGITNGLPMYRVSVDQSDLTWIKSVAQKQANRMSFYYNTAGAEYSYLLGCNNIETDGNLALGAILKFGYQDSYLRILRMANSWQTDDWEKISAGYADSAGTATTAACLTTDNTMKLYAQYNNEVNFGGTSNAGTLFFGYRKTDSRPIPTTIVFGGSYGDSQVKAKSFIKNGGTASQFLMANGSVTTTKNLTTSTNIGWSSTTADALLVPTMNTLAFWNGAFNANGASNLKYSSNGVIIGANNYTSYTPIVNSASTHATKDTKIIAPTSTGTSGYVITANSSGYAQWTAPSSLGKVGDADTLDSKHASDFTNYYSWTATIQGQTWSRICLITSASTVTGSSMLINVRGTRGSVVYNNSYVLNVSHPAGGGSLSQIAGIDYSTIKIRVYSTNTAVYSVELYDDAYSISSSTTQTVACSIIPLTSDIIVTKYIAFTDGTTVASGYSLVAELTSTSGVDIITKSIMATTFTGSLTGHASLDLPLAGGWMDTDASINFKGSSSSTAKYASIGYAAKSISGLVMHTTSTPNATKALYIQSNGYDSSSDTGGLAIDNDCVTVFGAGDTGSVFRVLNEDNVGDGAQFAVTKASGATVKYGLSVGTTITAAGAVTASNVWDIISITKSLTVTTSWSDTGIVLNASTITSGTGTYAIQVSATSICNSTDLWPAIYSGVCSIYTSGTNHDTESDEIELHSAGHAAKKRLYLRILCCLGANAKLQIASDTNMSTAYNYVFKFKRLI